MKVIMLHSVGNHNSSWHQNWLSVSLEHFEEFCKFLRKQNFQTLLLKDWYELQNNPKKILNNQIVLTFDDGYLDNLVYAYPILKKYELKATIFVNPEFVDPSNSIRPSIEDVWDNKLSQNQLSSLGFLNWNEIKFLDQTGIMDIQSHSMSHNYYFFSEKLLNYYNGQKEFHWLAWNLNKERKPFWLTENQKNFVPKGYPIFEFDRALGLKRFIPSTEFIEAFIMESSRYENYPETEKLDLLQRFLIEYKKKSGTIGVFESEQEMLDRYNYELRESKKILEEKLNKRIDFLCWPGGGYNDISISLSQDAGYLASTIASKENHVQLDNSGKYKRIQRFGLGSFQKKNGNAKYLKNRKTLIYNFQKRNSSLLNRVLIKLIEKKDSFLDFLR